MSFPLILSSLFLQFTLTLAQSGLDDVSEDTGLSLELLVGIGVVLFLCFCCALTLIVVYCCGGCKGRKENDTIQFQQHSDGTEAISSPTFAVSSVNPKLNTQKEKKLLTSSANARTVSPESLPNDVPANRRSPIVPNAVTKVAIPHKAKTRREKGLSFGRLDKTAQDRVRSVKLLAAQGGLVPILPSTERQYQEPVVEVPVETPVKKDPDAIRRKVERLAKQAGGGVYNTGSSTARLSMDIVKGFDLMREKKKMEAEQAEKKLAQQPNRTPKQSIPTPAPKKHEQMPEGKAKLMQFMDDLDEQDF